MKTIYYQISTGSHDGEEAFRLRFPESKYWGSVDYAEAGWIQKENIPEHWDIFCRYIDGQLIVRPDPPPYWDELGKGLISNSNSLFQRIRPLRYQSAYAAVNGAMSDMEAVIGISREQQPLGFTLALLRSILEQVGMPITPAEITETEALLVSCGFYPDFFTYAERVLNPPPPII